jgi:hypothetical protein
VYWFESRCGASSEWWDNCDIRRMAKEEAHQGSSEFEGMKLKTLCVCVCVHPVVTGS